MRRDGEPRYLKPAEYADKFRVSVRTVTNQCASGAISGAEKVGRQWRIPNPDFKERK